MKKLFLAFPAIVGLVSFGLTNFQQVNLPSQKAEINLQTAVVDEYGTVSIGIGDFEKNTQLPFTSGLQDCVGGCGCKDA
jgi:hypothetical protein